MLDCVVIAKSNLSHGRQGNTYGSSTRTHLPEIVVVTRLMGWFIRVRVRLET